MQTIRVRIRKDTDFAVTQCFEVIAVRVNPQCN
ncbi:Uncharacterised protein [Vibrio cholerae]|nr:Uncharacterised protein [Vibrio cholerae]